MADLALPHAVLAVVSRLPASLMARGLHARQEGVARWRWWWWWWEEIQRQNVIDHLSKDDAQCGTERVRTLCFGAGETAVCVRLLR